MTKCEFLHQTVHQHVDQKGLLFRNTAPYQLVKSSLGSQTSEQEVNGSFVFSNHVYSVTTMRTTELKLSFQRAAEN